VSEPLARHAMATVAPEAWRAMLASRPDLAGEPLVETWADAARPLVARRSVEGDPPQTTPLGLPLPPAQGKRRIAVSLPRAAVLAVTPPPRLDDARSAAPPAWRPTIVELLALDDQVRTYGSLAWAWLTGLAYLSASSDLDLLWTLPEPASLDPLLAGIAAIAARAPMRIDGEIVGAAGAVHWRELQGGGEVMVKHPTGVRLMTREAFLAGGRP